MLRCQTLQRPGIIILKIRIPSQNQPAGILAGKQSRLPILQLDKSFYQMVKVLFRDETAHPQNIIMRMNA